LEAFGLGGKTTALGHECRKGKKYARLPKGPGRTSQTEGFSKQRKWEEEKRWKRE